MRININGIKAPNQPYGKNVPALETRQRQRYAVYKKASVE